MSLQNSWEFIYNWCPLLDTVYKISGIIGAVILPLVIWFLSGYYLEAKRKKENDIIALNCLFAGERLCVSHFITMLDEYIETMKSISEVKNSILKSKKNIEEAERIDKAYSKITITRLFHADLKYSTNEINFIAKYNPDLYLELLELYDLVLQFNEMVKIENDKAAESEFRFIENIKDIYSQYEKEMENANNSLIKKASEVIGNSIQIKFLLDGLQQENKILVQNAKLNIQNNPRYANNLYLFFELKEKIFKTDIDFVYCILKALYSTLTKLMEVVNNKDFKGKVQLADRIVVDNLLKNIEKSLKVHMSEHEAFLGI